MKKNIKVTNLSVEFGSGRELLKHYLSKAEYIGEDGGMVTDGYITREQARENMIAKWREDCGDEDAQNFAENMSVDELVPGYFHLMTPEAREKLGADSDCEWYVSVDKVSGYKVWIYWG